MITANEIKKKTENIYVEYLESIVTEKAFFPRVIRSNKFISSDFNEMRKELAEVIEQSKDRKNFGYTITYNQINTRKHGIQSLPEEISFQTEIDFLKYLDKEKEVSEFRKNYRLILPKYPELKEWTTRNPLKIINNYDKWEDLLKVCDYFKATPKPNLYIRELPIEVHTKFIENNKRIITELLDILIKEYINQDEKKFEKRFNLKYDQPLIRFRVLDKNISEQYFSGIDDLSTPINKFEELKLPLKKVFVVENKMNVLTFPNVKRAIIIFGSGKGVENLKNIKWLEETELLYWGDLDVHGFEILTQFRNHFLNVTSFLMNEITLQKFENYKVKGKISKNSVELNLTPEELKLYNLLKENNWLLEQEKIPLDYVKEVVLNLTP